MGLHFLLITGGLPPIHVRLCFLTAGAGREEHPMSLKIKMSVYAGDVVGPGAIGIAAFIFSV
jgi:hypothetical protein